MDTCTSAGTGSFAVLPKIKETGNNIVWLADHTYHPEVIVSDLEGSLFTFSRESLLGSGSFAHTYLLTPVEQGAVKSGEITFQLSQKLNAHYVVKLLHEPELRLWCNLVEDDYKKISDLANSGMLTQENCRQEKRLEKLALSIDTIQTKNHEKQAGFLSEAEDEAAYFQRYYHASNSINQPIIVSGVSPFTTVKCSGNSVTTQYHPAALFLPCVPGVSLLEYPEKCFVPGFAFERLLALFVNIANEFSVAHGAGVLHLDGGPANILVDIDHDDKVMLIDFGKAQNIFGLDQEKTKIMSEVQKERDPYWRSARIIPPGKRPSPIVVGVEDDALALCTEIEYLLWEYESKLGENKFARCLQLCTDIIAKQLDGSPVDFSNALDVIVRVIVLVQRLCFLDSEVRKEEISFFQGKAEAVAYVDATKAEFTEMYALVEKLGLEPKSAVKLKKISRSVLVKASEKISPPESLVGTKRCDDASIDCSSSLFKDVQLLPAAKKVSVVNGL